MILKDYLVTFRGFPWANSLFWKNNKRRKSIFSRLTQWLFATPWTIVSGILQARILESGSRSLLQGIFPTQGSNSSLLHCRQILYQLSHQRIPTEWLDNQIVNELQSIMIEFKSRNFQLLWINGFRFSSAWLLMSKIIMIIIMEPDIMPLNGKTNH